MRFYLRFRNITGLGTFFASNDSQAVKSGMRPHIDRAIDGLKTTCKNCFSRDKSKLFGFDLLSELPIRVTLYSTF